MEKIMPKSDIESRRRMAKYGREEDEKIAALSKFIRPNGLSLSKI